MPRVRVEPIGITVEGPPGETVMDLATAQGYYWPQGCPSRGECTNCAMLVISGHARVTPMGRYERANLIRQRGVTALEDPRLRLACQTRIDGDIVVEKRGVEPILSFGASQCLT